MEFTIRRFDTTQSTNSDAQRGIKSDSNFTVYWAKFQERGRGQQGKGWESEPNKNLLLSILFKEIEIAPKDQFIISQIISLAVVDYLKKRGVEAKIKWPNDIYVGDKKICGILIENYLSGDILSASIAGIGININQRIFITKPPNPISLIDLISGEELGEDEFNLEKELHLLLQSIFNRYKNFFSGDRERSILELRAEYQKRLYRLNSFHLFYPSNQSTSEAVGELFEAKIVGVASDGKLQLVDRAGAAHSYYFKEIGYII